MTFYVFSRILNLQIHAHIYRSFIRHHKMLGVRIAKRKIVNDPTQFEQVDETCEFGGAVLYSESLGITAFFENVVPSKYETQKLKQLQFGIENEKIRQFEHECLIRLFQWSFLPPGKALDFSVCDEAFGCYKTQYRKRYLLEICQNASFLSTPDKKHRKLRFSMLFCYKNAANVVGQGVGQTLTHTLTHLPKCAERVKEHRRGSCFLSDALLERCLYLTCAMKLPIFSAALLCICRVAWV